MQLYFQNRQYLFTEYELAMNVLQGETDGEVGLYMGLDDWEYPLWALTKREEKNTKSINFRSVGVNNISRTISEDDFLPTHVIATKPIKDWKHASRYEPVYDSRNIKVYKMVHRNEGAVWRDNVSLIQGAQKWLLAH